MRRTVENDLASTSRARAGRKCSQRAKTVARNASVRQQLKRPRLQLSGLRVPTTISDPGHSLAALAGLAAGRRCTKLLNASRKVIKRRAQVLSASLDCGATGRRGLGGLRCRAGSGKRAVGLDACIRRVKAGSGHVLSDALELVANVRGVDPMDAPTASATAIRSQSVCSVVNGGGAGGGGGGAAVCAEAPGGDRPAEELTSPSAGRKMFCAPEDECCGAKTDVAAAEAAARACAAKYPKAPAMPTHAGGGAPSAPWRPWERVLPLGCVWRAVPSAHHPCSCRPRSASGCAASWRQRRDDALQRT